MNKNKEAAGQERLIRKATTDLDYSTTEQKLTNQTQLYPCYSSVSSKKPSCFKSLSDLVFDASFPKVGAKIEAEALTPFKAEAKTNEQAINSLYHALIQDHDDDDKDSHEIEALYNGFGVAYLAYTSASHQQDKGGVKANRWKVVLPLSCQVDCERYEMLSTGLALINNTDSAQARKAQVFFAPNKLSEKAPYEYISQIKKPFIDPYDDDHPLVRACLEAYEAQKAEEAKLAAPKSRSGLTAAEGGIIDKVNQQYVLTDELGLSGYKKTPTGYLAPNSTTGLAGVKVFSGDDGVVRCYSHHDTADPLSNLNNSGHSLDVFDVICILQYGGDVKRAVAELAERVDPEGQKQRQREYMQAQSRAATIEQLGVAATREAEQLAKYIHQRLIDALRVDEKDARAVESIKPDAEVITRMINGAFWSGSKSKMFMLNHNESLLQFREPEAFKFLVRTHGAIIDRSSVEELAELLSYGKEKPEAEEKARAKHVSSCMNIPNDVIIDHLKYQNQRESIEWRVDMFATASRMELLEDKARIVLTHTPFPTYGRPERYAEIISDYKDHFKRFDEFLSFLVASRFAIDRKKAYLWILADSDWGKGFLTGVLAELGVCVETSMKEIEAMFEGKPVGRSSEDFKRALVLLIDEFKTVKSELKQLQSTITLSPKNQLTCSVEIFAKVFTSAESVGSLVTENGVEDQFANRMSIFKERGSIDERPLFNSVGKGNYYRAVLAYTAQRLNEGIGNAQKMGRERAEAKADAELTEFIKRNGLDTMFERFSDSLPDLAAEMAKHFIGANYVGFLIYDKEDNYLTSAAKNVDAYLESHFDYSELAGLRRKKAELMQLMSEDGKGVSTYRLEGRPVKALKLKKV